MIVFAKDVALNIQVPSIVFDRRIMYAAAIISFVATTTIVRQKCDLPIVPYAKATSLYVSILIL